MQLKLGNETSTNLIESLHISPVQSKDDNPFEFHDHKSNNSEMKINNSEHKIPELETMLLKDRRIINNSLCKKSFASE